MGLKLGCGGNATSVTCTWIIPAFDVPVRITMNSSYAHLRGEQRTEPAPLKPICSDTARNKILHGQDLALGAATELGPEVRISAVFVGYPRQLD